MPAAWPTTSPHAAGAGAGCASRWPSRSSSCGRGWPRSTPFRRPGRSLLPLAALAGPALHLSNSLADVEADRQAGTASLATRLGERRARVVLAWLVVAVVGLGWAALLLLGAVPLAAAFLGRHSDAPRCPGRGLVVASGSRRSGGWLARPRHRPGLAGRGVGEHGRHTVTLPGHMTGMTPTAAAPRGRHRCTPPISTRLPFHG